MPVPVSLGITPATPGFQAVHFQPCLGDLAWAEGDIPTPRGTVQVRLTSRPGEKPLARLRVPAGMEVRIAESTRQAWQIEIQG